MPKTHRNWRHKFCKVTEACVRCDGLEGAVATLEQRAGTDACAVVRPEVNERTFGALQI